LRDVKNAVAAVAIFPQKSTSLIVSLDMAAIPCGQD
jgi:hypothetical protein